MNSAPDMFACASCLCLASRKAARAITAAYERRLRRHGIRATQFSILVMLMLAGPTPQGALAKALGVERTTLTRNLAVMERKGWLTVAPDASDARVHVVAVTDAGRQLAEQAFPDWRDAQDQMSALFGDTGVEALHKLAAKAAR